MFTARDQGERRRPQSWIISLHIRAMKIYSGLNQTINHCVKIAMIALRPWKSREVFRLGVGLTAHRLTQSILGTGRIPPLPLFLKGNIYS